MTFRCLIASLALVAAAQSALATPGQAMSRYQAGLYGQELYSVGSYIQAIDYLKAAVYDRVERPAAIEGLSLSDPRFPAQGRPDFAWSLAEAYWEIGHTQSAVLVSRQFLDGQGYALWRCKAAEQERLWVYAERCYRALGEHDRLRRVIRQQALFTR